MPIYEYQCNTCSHEFEKLVLNTDDTDICCPACDSLNVSKKMSAVCLRGTRTDACDTAAPGGFS